MLARRGQLQCKGQGGSLHVEAMSARRRGPRGRRPAPRSAKDLKAVGITLGSLGNPFFVALAKGAEAKAKQINPNVKVTTASADYDLNKQFIQIDNFIAAGVDLILLNAADAKAIVPAVKRAQAGGHRRRRRRRRGRRAPTRPCRPTTSRPARSPASSSSTRSATRAT